jgi:AbrB family looped-hinge helix DNA binding protein
MAIVKIQRKGQITLPMRVRAAIGVSDGDLVDVKASGGRIIVTPTVVIDRSKFPNASFEYTSEQRRIIDSCLAEAQRGPFSGPFKDGAEIAAFLKRQRGSKSKRSKNRR